MGSQRVGHDWATFTFRQHFKKQTMLYLQNPSSQSYGFSSTHVWMWDLDHKEGWAPKNRCFWTVVLEKTLESPLDCKEIQPVHPKGNQSWIFIGRTDAETETPIVWPPDVKNWLIWKDADAGKDWRQEKGITEDEMVGWHHQLNGHEFKQTPGDGEKQGGLVWWSSWGCKESDTTKQLNNTMRVMLHDCSHLHRTPVLGCIFILSVFNQRVLWFFLVFDITNKVLMTVVVCNRHIFSFHCSIIDCLLKIFNTFPRGRSYFPSITRTGNRKGVLFFFFFLAVSEVEHLFIWFLGLAVFSVGSVNCLFTIVSTYSIGVSVVQFVGSLCLLSAVCQIIHGSICWHGLEACWNVCPCVPWAAWWRPRHRPPDLTAQGAASPIHLSQDAELI